MFITELDVINDMLASLGELPVNAVTEDHPLVAAGLRMLRVCNLREQAKTWWFNKELVTLSPDAATGFIYVPADTINIDPASQWTRLTQRGRRLFDPTRPDGYIFGSSVVCTLIRCVPFEELPPLAQAYISLDAQKDFQKAYDADRVKYEQLAADRRDAYMTLRAEDIRNRKSNLLYNPTTLAQMTAAGMKGPMSGTQHTYSAVAGGGSCPPPVDLDTPNFVDLFEETLT